MHTELDRFVGDLAIFGRHLALKGIIPANAGDVSSVLSAEASKAISKQYSKQTGKLRFSRLAELRNIRRDGRNYYNAESVPDELVQPLLTEIASRVLVISATGAKLWDVERHPEKQLCLIRVTPDGRGFHILFGNEEYGLIPSIEVISHLVANATNLRQGLQTSAALHVHPPNLVAIESHSTIDGSYVEFNKVLYTQKEGVLTNASDLIGLVPYHPSGSRALFESSVDSIEAHRITLWGKHGVFIRERSIERCVDLLEYAEDAAIASVRSLTNPGSFKGLEIAALERAIGMYSINPALLELLRERK